MTDKPDRTWWEFDPDERPVPLLDIAEPAGAQEQTERLGARSVMQDAQSILSAGSEEIVTKDSHRSMFAVGRKEHRPLFGKRDVSWQEARVRRSTGAVAALVLLAGCIAMFALGWRQGSAAAPKCSSVEAMTDIRSQEVAHRLIVRRGPSSICGRSQSNTKEIWKE